MRDLQEYQYLNLVSDLIGTGFPKEGRNGLTYSLFGRQLRFDMGQGFPLLTTKKVSFHNIAHELMWFLRGGTNVRYLQDRNVHIWDEWADADGNLGPVYGAQWRSWPLPDADDVPPGASPVRFLDQIAEVTKSLREDPNGRRHIVTAWNPADIGKMKLPPCHMMFQFYVQGRFLSIHMYQRSADIFLGVPYNIASYALLLHLMANHLGLEAKDVVISFGDVHLYATHLDQAQEQIKRLPRSFPTLSVVPISERAAPWEYQVADFQLGGYDPHPALRAPVSV